MSETKTICGISHDKIRKAYFTKKIPQLLAEIQAKASVEESELQELAGFLEEMRNEERANVTRLQEIIPEMGFDEVRPPTVAELTSEATEEDKKALDQWYKEKEWAVNTTQTILRGVTKKLIKKVEIKKETYMNWAHELTGILGYLNEDKVYKEQLYMKRLTGLIDTYGISRREAEDRSKVTQEYADYKNAHYLLEQVDNFIMNCKKEQGDKFN